ncbi:MAG: hypothetical protein ABI772_13805 [Bacteroidota bacterium]
MKKRISVLTLVTILIRVTLAYCQVSTLTNTATTGLPTEYVGWDGTGGFNKHLDIKNSFTGNYNINFWTNNGTSTTQKMTIIGSSGATDGYVGIGTSYTPSFKLDVDGDINMASFNNAYKMGGANVLSQAFSGGSFSVFVGYGAGGDVRLKS